MANGASSDPITSAEVTLALKDLATRMHKSPGLDGVYAWMVVLGGQAVHDALLALYQKVWCSGKLPESWNEARISYLHKKGSKTEVSNYRPISLISVLAKTFTRTWVGRLQEIAADHLVKEQGCGQKGQGAPEHLWAFMDLMEEGVSGGTVGGGGETPGTYALFADVAKAYDQVWRDGLYLTLYSMGVRGAMWHIIQEWLNNATACTTWNGVRGPTVVLEEGLRQGCVLSPILYCIFINCFLAKRPVDIPVPEYAERAVSSLYAQGLQGKSLEGEGVRSAALGRFIMAMLYMDDTALVARSKVGLQSLTEKYMHFCKMFRMLLNHKKSKVMHYRRAFKDGEDAGYEAGGVRFEQPKAPEKTLANARMGRTQPYLGFLTDECLSGRAHHNRALAIGHAQARKVGEVSAKMGEDMGLMYLKGVVGPKAL